MTKNPGTAAVFRPSGRRVASAIFLLACLPLAFAPAQTRNDKFSVIQTGHSRLEIKNGSFMTNFENGCGIFFSSDEDVLDAVAVIRTNYLYAATFDDVCSDHGSGWRNYSTILIYPSGRTFDYYYLPTGGDYELSDRDSVYSLYGIPSDISLTNGRILVSIGFCLSDPGNGDNIGLNTNAVFELLYENPDPGSYNADYEKFLVYLMDHYKKYFQPR